MTTRTTLATARKLITALQELYTTGFFTDPKTPPMFVLGLADMEMRSIGFVVNDSRKTTFGLEVVFGPHAERAANARVECSFGLRPFDDAAMKEMGLADQLTVVLTPLANLRPNERRIIEELGLVGRRDAIVPHLLTTPAGEDPKMMRPPEMRWMSLVLEGLLEAHRSAAWPQRTNHQESIVRLDIELADTGNVHVHRSFDDVSWSDSILEVIRSRIEPTPEAIVDAEPAALDFDAWRRVGMVASRTTADTAATRYPFSKALSRRYFGDDVDQDDAFERFSRHQSEAAYSGWLSRCHRVRRGAPTVLEEQIANSKARPERLFLEGWRDARLSFHRVESIEYGKSLRIVDLIDGRTRTLHDRGLSESVIVNLILVGWAFEVHGYGFWMVAGPPISAMQFSSVTEYLRTLGVQMTHASIEAKPHLLGRLYEFLEQEPSTPRIEELTTIDGHPVELLEATFALTRPDALRQLLAADPDIEADLETDSYVCLLPTKGMDRNSSSLWASISIIGNEAIVTTDSRQHLEKLRERIEGSGCGEMLQASTPKRTPRASSPMIDGPRSTITEVPAEALSDLVEAIQGAMLRWLDESIPAFGHRTPREHARTKKGRDEIRTMILSMPDADIPGVGIIPVPRELMFRSLGMQS